MSVNGLHAVSVEDGLPSTLNFKFSNPTGQNIVLTGITLEPYDRDTNRDNTTETYIYNYRAEIHHYKTTDQGIVDEILLEVHLSPGQIIEFKPDAEYYVRLIYNPPTQPPAVEPQKGLPHGYLTWVKFTYAVKTTEKNAEGQDVEIRTSHDFRVEAFID